MTASTIPAGLSLHSWYCPALSAYRWPDEELIPQWQHLLTRFPWVPLYVAAEGAAVPEGWTLRSYYCPDEKSFYASHRTISEKTIAKSVLLGLYAAHSAEGNDSAGHVPPLKKNAENPQGTPKGARAQA